MISYAIISIIISASCLFMGNFIYYRNPNNQLNQLLAIFSFFVGYLAFTDFGSIYSNTPEQAYWWVKAAFPWMFVASIFLHLALLATEQYSLLHKKITYLIIYLPSAIFATLNLTTKEITQGVQVGYWGWTYVPSESLVYPLVLLWTFSLAFLSAILVLTYYIKSLGIQRQQAKYIFIGVNLPLILGMLTELILPALSIPAPSILNLLMALGIAFIVYGIWKFRLPQLTSSMISDKILSTMSNFLFLMDEKGKIIHVNIKAIKLSGFSEKEIQNQGLDIIFPQIDLPDTYSHPLENFETVLRTKDNQEIPVLASTSIIKTNEQDILGLVLVGSDISQLKKIEAERDRYREHLEEIVEERTRELEETNRKLKYEIIAHKKAEEELKDSLDEKELLVKEIHHRVKNNLMIISSLLNLQSHYITDDKARTIFQESQNRAKSMALIHERLYRTESLRKIEFDDYIRTLATDLFHSYNLGPGINLSLDLEPVKLDVNSAIPLGLIANELVTNSFKYAFPSGQGKLSIKFHQLNEMDDKLGKEFEMIISDDGIGFPEDVDFREVDSLGLQLVNNLTSQLNGTIDLDRSHGTKFTIRFKESKYSK
ncbi:MAG: PAS domain S-box protein [Methanobacteriaceae archaeon]|nr:PAS domain S-box protein [Methanobacteriaceae archaeon]